VVASFLLRVTRGLNLAQAGFCALCCSELIRPGLEHRHSGAGLSPFNRARTPLLTSQTIVPARLFRYPESMNVLPEPRPGQFLLLAAPRAASEKMLAFTARLAQAGPLRVVDGGNRFNVYILARLAGRLKHETLPEILRRVWIARAFTCFQMAALLEQIPALPNPTLVIDFLNTFYDESVPLAERRRVLGACLVHLRRLSRPAAVVVSVRPPPPLHVDPTGLLDAVRAAADLVWYPDIPSPKLPQRLF
jgi:hypothetical protein